MPKEAKEMLRQSGRDSDQLLDTHLVPGGAARIMFIAAPKVTFSLYAVSQ